LKSLAPDVPKDFLRSIWSNRLPPHIPIILAGQAEAQFSLASVTSETTKFNYLVSRLEYRHAAEVEDIIVSPPVN
jgi:hypothetical protein